MRVAIILPPREGYGPGHAGAIGLLTRRLAGPDTLVFGGAQRGPTFAEGRFQAVRPLPLALSLNTRFGASAAWRLRRARPVLVEVYNRPGIALRLAAWLRPTPVVLCLQNDPQDMRDAATSEARERLLDRLAGVIVASEWLRHQLMQGVQPGETPVHVLPNAIDLHAIPPAPARRDDLVLFAGRLVADKGADSFVAACARALPRLPRWRAEMIGADRFGANTPETPFIRALRPRAAAAGVTLGGYQPHDAVLAAMRRAAIVVAPSRWQEPFGLVALEAMACGAALIASPRGALPEVAGDTAVYVDPDDPQALADAVIELAEDPDRRAALAHAGEHRARLFDAREARLRLAEIRADILDRWSRRRP